MNKWTKEELETHIEVNLNDSYSAAVVVSVLYEKIYGEKPKIGLSGFQVEAIDSLAKVLPEVGIAEAINILKRELINDESYRMSWQANIAMAFKDKYEEKQMTETVHVIANEAADYFLTNLVK